MNSKTIEQNKIEKIKSENRKLKKQVKEMEKENKNLNEYLERINHLIYNTLMLKNFVVDKNLFTKKIMNILNDWAEKY